MKLAIVFTTLWLAIFSTTCGAQADELLLLGTKSPVVKPLSIAIRKPVSFNYKTWEEIITMRKQVADANRVLLKTDYKASMEVFDHIEDKKPWWGLAGQAVFGPGMQSIVGPSEESRFVLNPYLLVGANSATVGIWNPQKFTKEELNSADFPFFWAADRLIWEPRRQQALVSYDIHSYLNSINKSGKLKKPMMPNAFSLVAYNARDFGFQWIYLDTKASKNVVNTQATDKPTWIPQFIHCGGSCGYPGGCNNMSPYTPAIDRLELRKVPAQAIVKLWYEKPSSVNATADMVFVLDFR